MKIESVGNSKYGLGGGTRESDSFVGNEYEGLKLPEMKELLKPMEEVVLKLKDKIKNNEYNFIIGDDASGRVPALILHKVIKQIYNENGKDIGVTFLAGSRETEDLETKTKNIEDFLRDKLSNISNPDVLIVTELIHRGSSLVPFTEVLKNLGAKYDVATTGLLRKYRLDELEKKLQSKIIYGKEFKPEIDGDYVIAGVEKSYEDLFARRYEMDEDDRTKFVEGRQDIALLAQKLVEYYKTLS